MTYGLALATRGLQKRYGSRPALAGLDLSVPTGVVYGILGLNLPFNAANAVVATSGSFGGDGGGTIARLDPNTALVVVLAWLVGALVVTAIFTERAEISG